MPRKAQPKLHRPLVYVQQRPKSFHCCAKWATTPAPQRGANQTPLRACFAALRAALAASGPRLWRSSAWGVPPPGPLGLRPLCRLRGTGPRCLSSSAKRRAGEARRAVRLLEISSPRQGRRGCSRATGGLGARAPPDSGAVGNRVEPVGSRGQRAALSPLSTGDPGCPRRNGPQGATVAY